MAGSDVKAKPLPEHDGISLAAVDQCRTYHRSRQRVCNLISCRHRYWRRQLKSFTIVGTDVNSGTPRLTVTDASDF